MKQIAGIPIMKFAQRLEKVMPTTYQAEVSMSHYESSVNP
jgi:hypothetical protein